MGSPGTSNSSLCGEPAKSPFCGAWLPKLRRSYVSLDLTKVTEDSPNVKRRFIDDSLDVKSVVDLTEDSPNLKTPRLAAKGRELELIRFKARELESEANERSAMLRAHIETISACHFSQCGVTSSTPRLAAKGQDTLRNYDIVGDGGESPQVSNTSHHSTTYHYYCYCT